MGNALKSEFRKLYTIRSTYIISIIGFLFVGFLSFYIEGMRGEASMLDPHKVQTLIITAANFLSIFVALVAVLLITHEYRYNTIMYTLSSSNNRSKVLLAKIVALLTHGVLYAIVGVCLSIFLMYAGMAVKDMAPYAGQTVAWGDIIWRSLFVTLGYGALGLVLGMLFRNVVGAIVTLFMANATVEPLLGLLLKENIKYLPFHAIDQVGATVTPTSLSHGTAALVFGGYLVVFYAVAWVMFIRRDAN